MELEISKFKHVLEYFVTHQNYLLSDCSKSVRGYDPYLKPFVDNGNFASTGQGYNDDRIQDQIRKWDNICSHQICLNIQPNFGSYKSKKSYLNWRDTGLNIFCDWGQSEVIALSIGYAYWWLKPTQYNILLSKTISELNLYEEKGDNSLLEEFYNLFVKEINDYDNHQGEYFLKEKCYFQKKEQEKNMEKNKVILDMVVKNYNLILTGAPGTGKTYLAKQIAQQLIFGEPKEIMTDTEQQQFDEHCKFVQFHPSYDYTDFVEGLRPIKNAKNEQIGFERRDGVFKEFCSKAAENLENSRKEPEVLSHELYVEKIYNNLLSKIENEEITEIPLKTKNKKMLIDNVSDNKNIRLKTPGSTSFTNYVVSLKRILKLSNKYKNKESLERITNISEDIRNVIGGCNASAYWAVLHLIYDQENPISTDISSVTNKPFVFIIDEINRGEISKIFGELFFSIDPGYRGTIGKVQTQYQNLIDEDDDFYDGFYVPENVYIIGTMNDIDRSVESMDFAFRRRFAFKEIKADENVGMLDGLEWKDKAIERMTHLNEEIEKIEGLSSAYHIGASYFLKLTNYDGDFNKLWDYHLEGLLREYLRGMQDVEGKIKQLKKVYGYGSDSNNGQ